MSGSFDKNLGKKIGKPTYSERYPEKRAELLRGVLSNPNDAENDLAENKNCNNNIGSSVFSKDVFNDSQSSDNPIEAEFLNSNCNSIETDLQKSNKNLDINSDINSNIYSDINSTQAEYRNSNSYGILSKPDKKGFFKNSEFLESTTNGSPLKRNRIWELDFIRAICLLLMIMDHVMYLQAFTFGIPWHGWRIVAGASIGGDFTLWARWYWTSVPRNIIHPIVLFLFFSISGIACSFSRSNLKRGLELAGLAVVYSLVTYYLQNDMGLADTFVHFGVLHLIAFCILLYCLVDKLVKLATKNKAYGKWITSGVFLTLFLTVTLLFHLYTPPKTTPKWLFFMFPEGIFFTQEQLSPGDFFPIIPWSAFFFFGVAIAPLLYGKRRSLIPALDRAWNKPFQFIAKHGLFIYCTHIIVLTLIYAVISFAKYGTWVVF